MQENLVTAPHTLADRSLSDRPLLFRQWKWLTGFARRKPLAAFSGLIVVILLFAGVFANVVAPHSYTERSRDRFQTWSVEHPMGTDKLGRDIFSRIIYGARVSVIVGFGTIAISQILATLLGTTSGYFGGWTDTLVQRLVEVGQAFPGLVFIISLLSVFGPGMYEIIIALGIIFSFGASRVVRGATIAARQNQYVEAAQTLGAGHTRILLRHILPNVMPVIIVGATVQLGTAILIEASLSFLGYGVPPPYPSWGMMLDDARDSMVNYPHLAIWPGLAVFLAVYAFNMLGDGLRDVLDPRLRGTR